MVLLFLGFFEFSCFVRDSFRFMEKSLIEELEGMDG